MSQDPSVSKSNWLLIFGFSFINFRYIPHIALKQLVVFHFFSFFFFGTSVSHFSQDMEHKIGERCLVIPNQVIATKLTTQTSNEYPGHCKSEDHVIYQMII
jgi:hypothetical protein